MSDFLEFTEKPQIELPLSIARLKFHLSGRSMKKLSSFQLLYSKSNVSSIMTPIWVFSISFVKVTNSNFND